MRRIVVLLTIVLLTGIAALAFAWDRFTTFLSTPAAEHGEEKLIVIPQGVTPRMVVDILGKEHLVSNPDWMKMYVDHFGRELVVHSGEYSLTPTMSPVELLRRISSGRVVTYTFSIPPGAEAREIAHLLDEKKLGDEAEIKKLVFDPQLAKSLGIPSESLEGFLFPDAYDLPRGLSPRALLEIFVQRYQKIVTRQMLQDAGTRGLGEKELITIASLIEKSNVHSGERRLYSALIRNRLKNSMPLESEASVEYGLHRFDLTPDKATEAEKDHPWNTMTKAGLPPTPIANPSLASIAAAAEPAQSGALWMIPRPDGTHQFCEDRECYQAALKPGPPGQPGQKAPRADNRGKKGP